MIKSEIFCKTDKPYINILHNITAILFIALYAFPLFPFLISNILLILFSALTLVYFFLRPVPINKLILKNLVFLLPFVPYLIEFIFNYSNGIARFEFEKKLFFFTAVFTIPLFLKVSGFNNYKLPLLIFVLLISVLSLYSFANLLASGIFFEASAYENGSFELRYAFEKLARLHPTYYSIFALVAGGILIDFSKNNKKLLRIIGYSLAIFLFLCVLIIAVRIAFITFGFYIFVWIGARKHRIWQKILWIMGTLIFLSVAVYVIPSLNKRFGEFLRFDELTQVESNTISQRTIIFGCTLEVLKKKWLSGYGSGQFQKELSNCYASYGWHEGAKRNFNPHNQFLSISIAYGLIFMFVFIICLYLVFRKIFRLKGGIYFCLAIFLFFITESMLERSMGVYFFGLFAVLLYNTENNTENETNNNT